MRHNTIETGSTAAGHSEIADPSIAGHIAAIEHSMNGSSRSALGLPNISALPKRVQLEQYKQRGLTVRKVGGDAYAVDSAEENLHFVA